MKPGVNLEQAGEAETIGALAVNRRAAKSRRTRDAAQPTPAQSRALGALICSVLESARLAGAGRRRVKLGNVSLKLQGHGAEEILSVHKLAGV